MKNRIIKLTSFLLVLIIAASVLYSCKGGDDNESTTEEQVSEVVATTAGGTTELTTSTVAQNEIDKIVKAALGDDADWDGDYSSLSQDQRVDIMTEMYDRGYIARFNDDELFVVTIAEYEAAQKSSTSSGDIEEPEGETTGNAATSGQKVSTTAKGVTTTARRGIVPGTTAKNGITTTTKKSSSVTTTKAGSASTTASNSASTTSSSGGSGDVGEGQITKPEVTYLDKYVINVINSGKYTIKMVYKEEVPVAATIYIDGNNKSTVGVVTFGIVRFTTKLIIKNDKYYVVLGSPIFQYAEATKEDLGGIIDEDLSEAISFSSLFKEMDTWEYLGITRTTGMNIESYKDSNGTIQKFYFNSSGLQKVDFVSNGNTETMNIVIESGVSSPDAFTIPSGYKKTTLDEMGKSLSDIIPGA